MQEEFYWQGADDTITYWEHYKKVYSQLCDEESLHVFICLIMVRILGIRSYYKECCNTKYPQYFDKDILTPSHPEVFVDGGAFIGDTAIEMNRSFNADCKIISYELDEKNSALAELNWEKENIHNAELRLVGLSDKCRAVNIISADNNSHITEATESFPVYTPTANVARLVSLDEMMICMTRLPLLN